ncbi:hypothetical protein V9K67_09965 [Paraflavisolibacter sp. H34]|uniref:hypothetical protein n=1 Tax=Huijunlia imazamoxiresistens TaxID=3127457 RepID=UPI0030170ED2
MERLFSTHISINGRNAEYHVVFDHEKYIFQPEAQEGQLPTFSFIREHDEWHDQEPVAPAVKKQAVDQLEKYLLRQH